MLRYECQDVQAVLSGLLDGELDEHRRHAADAHLAGCASCREALQKAEDLDGLMRMAFAAGERWPQTIEQRVAAAIGEGVDSSNRRRLMLVAWSGWISAAAALVMLAVVWQVGTGSGGRSETSAVRPEVADATGVSDLTSEISDFTSEISDPSFEISDSQIAIADSSEDSSTAASAMAMSAGPSEELRTAAPEAMISIEPLRDVFASTWDVVGSAAQRAGEYVARLTTMPVDATIGEEMFALADGQSPSETVAVETIQRDEEPGPGTARLAETRDEVAASDEPLIGPGEYVHLAAVLMHVLEHGPDDSFGDLHFVRTVEERENLSRRLAEVSTADPQAAPVLAQARTALEMTHGVVDQNQLRRLRHDLERHDVSHRLERLSERYSR